MNKRPNKKINKKSKYPTISSKVLKIAKDILKKYDADFKELSSK